MELSETRRRASTAALTVLRLTLGIIMTAHGWQKLVDTQATIEGFTQMGVPAPGVTVYLAMAGELLGGLGLIFGALTPVAAFGVLAVMVGAIFTVHIGNGLFAQNNGWEFPLLILMTSLYFMARGAGPVSVDALVRQRARAGEGRRREREHPPREAHG
ncbi:MAG: DoxX family protein [Myxococcota bacterium]